MLRNFSTTCVGSIFGQAWGVRYPNHGIADHMKVNHTHENCRQSNPLPTHEVGIGATVRGKYHHAFRMVRSPEQQVPLSERREKCALPPD